MFWNYLSEIYPNAAAYKILITVTNSCISRKTPLKKKKINNYWRSCICQKQLMSLSIILIENKVINIMYKFE